MSFIDTYGCVVSDQGSPPASYGDSAAESGRLAHLNLLLGESTEVFLNAFTTEQGYVRHPSPLMPDDWRESDMSCDQTLPLFLAMRLQRYGLGAIEMRHRLEEAGWKTGNGDYVSPVFYGLLTDKKWLINLATAVQALLFKLPYRWSDSKKKFETTEDNSGDYLNFIHAGLYAAPWARRLVSKETLISKLQHYYRNEPNNEPLIQLYKVVLNRLW